MSTIEENIAKQALRRGQEMPARIANAPKLILGLELYLQAFFDLDTERVNGFGLSFISWSSIKRYATINNFDTVQEEDLFYFIRGMDKKYLQQASKKMKNNRKK